MKEISIHTFKEIIETEHTNPTVDFINVCTPTEYSEKHIPGVRSVPLDELSLHLDEFKNKNTVYIHCRSGKRGRSAIEKLKSLGVKAELINVSGGILAWDEAGFDTNSLSRERMPLMQQVMLIAGMLILLGHLLSFTVHPHALYLSVFVGLGLTFSGLTGWCGMALILSKMPWNK
jgi:rhodanese-related sulfurtransferase